MTKKLFVFDLDGTMLNSEKEVLTSTHGVLEEIKKAGHEIAIATGRNFTLSQKTIEETNINHYIVCNGSAGYIQSKQFYINPLERKELDKLINIALEKEHHVIYQTPTDLKRHYKEISPRVEESMNFIKQPIPDYGEDFKANDEIVQLLLFINEEELKEYYQNKFQHLQFVRWYDNAVDVIPERGSKWQTILRLSERLNIHEDNIVVFGDGNNDFEMISNAKVSIAMGNAHDYIKKEATFVAENNDNDGIEKVIKENKLI